MGGAGRKEDGERKGGWESLKGGGFCLGKGREGKGREGRYGYI